MSATINYWLLKSEPSHWSLEHQKQAGVAPWDGVRNYSARNNMKAMQVGDICLFYHSIEQKAIVGLVKVVKEHYPDPEDERFVIVDVEFYQELKTPVTLKQIKEHELLKNMVFAKQSRLSVSGVSQEEYNVIMELGAK